MDRPEKSDKKAAWQDYATSLETECVRLQAAADAAENGRAEEERQKKQLQRQIMKRER